ncbi:MAG TPA: helix-turn-helix domain-containing protein [Flavobacterium sp.]|jgi:DNA-binding XRE family transcriptional regulator|nr:helix-turn-helix domain-containing protein [Flavobacterium sp.]
MVHSDDFIKRLETILEYYSLSASAFADKIGVQRSGLSHLLSGRNKPSLDFILKIIEHFPDVNLYWILNGKGTFPQSNSDDLFSMPAPAPVEQKLMETSEPEKAVLQQPFKKPDPLPTAIQKIVIFYTDGTFSEYKPQ